MGQNFLDIRYISFADFIFVTAHISNIFQVSANDSVVSIFSFNTIINFTQNISLKQRSTHIGSYYIKWFTASWTYGRKPGQTVHKSGGKLANIKAGIGIGQTVSGFKHEQSSLYINSLAFHEIYLLFVTIRFQNIGAVPFL